MGWHGCQDKGGGDGVEGEVENPHSHLQPPAPLSTSLSKHCQSEGFSQNTLHQIEKGQLRQEPFEEDENEKRNDKDEGNGKDGSIEAGIDAIAIAVNSCCHRCGAETACTEEGGENKHWAELCDHLQLLAE